MKGGNKIWSTLVDYFLILSAIIGVGFASGKEVYVFFFSFGGASVLGLIAFVLLYIYLFFIVEHVKRKLQLNSYNQFNRVIFGGLSKFSNVVLVVNFVIASAGMLAGADYLFKTFFNVGFKIPSTILSIITFVVLLGGIKKIKAVANFIIPIMITVIVVNSIANVTPANVNLKIIDANIGVAVYYALLFGVTNFVAAFPVLFQTSLKVKGRLAVVFSVALIILLNILVLASNATATDMPMFELSQNLGNSFYILYFVALIFGLFSTLIICSFNTQTILNKNKKSWFISLIIVLTNLIISNFGYNFIVKNLYIFSGMISGVYILFLLLMIIIKLRKNFKNNKNQHIKN